jgi:SAM-dependent methyltransferase
MARRRRGRLREPPLRLPARAVAQIIRGWSGRRLDAEFSVMRLRWRPDGRVLELGAGSGELLERFRDLGWSVHGVDFDPAAVKAAASRGIDLVQADVQSLDYPGESFDAVVMEHVIEHVEDPAAVLGEAWRVLAPGGELVVVTPNADSMLHRRYGADWLALDAPRHFQVFTRKSLIRLAEEVGVEHVSIVTTARSANGVARAAWKFRRDGRWNPKSRPSLAGRVAMEVVQEWEAFVVRRRPDAGEELVLSAVKD